MLNTAETNAQNLIEEGKKKLQAEVNDSIVYFIPVLSMVYITSLWVV